jgi:hypothetical protein
MFSHCSFQVIMLSQPLQVTVADAAQRPNMRMLPECLANFFLGPPPNGRKWTPAEAVAATPYSVRYHIISPDIMLTSYDII